MRIRWRLPLALALTTLVFAGIVALASALLLRGVLFDRLQDDMSRQAHQFAAVLATGPQSMADDPAALENLTRQLGAAGEVRFTLIEHDGTVLADSEADPSALENHATRPEVAQALQGHEGRARRHSATLGQEEVYVAIPLPESAAPWSRGVLRAALPASRIDATLASSWRIPLIAWAILLLPTLAVAYFWTRSITFPIERLRHMTALVASGDLASRTSVRTQDELGDLANSLNNMASQLESRAEQLGAEMERSTRVLEAMTDGVLLVDADGRLLRSNPAAEAILGVKLAGTEGSPLVFAARSFPGWALSEKARAAGHAITEVIELPGGRSIAVEVLPLQSPDAEPRQMLFVMRDETARRAVERMRRDFATNVSHELKTPLAGLSLLAETLAHAIKEDPDEAQKFVDRLAAEISRLKVLTTDLLTLSRLEEPETGPESEFVLTDLARLAREVLVEVEPLAMAKSQEISADLAGEAPVSGDEVALRTLVRNLLDNAVRYTDPGGQIRVAVRAEPSLSGPGSIVLTVEDDGVGIPQAEQQRIFERFYRVDKARSRETGGTGLGLSIVRHVADRHGGSVEVESTLGVGSTFTVRIPAVG
ncbi:MAG: ATP-binding protein [Chloroflexi bacterium]|nr:ATP-binding protein [Chloroflexota bacterium]